MDAQENPPVRIGSPVSQAFIDRLRADSESMPHPRSVLTAMAAELHQAERDGYEGEVRGDKAAVDDAVRRRDSWQRTINVALNTVAEEFVAMAAIAADREPATVQRLLSNDALGTRRITALETTVAVLQSRIDQLESAMREVAGVLS